MNKTAVKNFAVSARIFLKNAVMQKALACGISENGEVITKNECISDEKNQLIQKIQKDGFSQIIEETAYFWFHRLMALRFMEVNHYFSEKLFVLGQQNESFILEQCRKLYDNLPEMFDMLENWRVLLFPDNLCSSGGLIEKMISTVPEEDWKQIQIIGWLHQYYHAESKKRVFQQLKHQMKISAENIPHATQLFTPEWIVCYMVDNSLGRFWKITHPDSDLNFRYNLEEAPQEISVKTQLEEFYSTYQLIPPEELKMIDPCMGAGHILIYAFDVLMRIYISCGYSAKEATVKILKYNLYGLDIDRHAYQLAYFALMMKAGYYYPEILKEKISLNLANFSDTALKNNITVPQEFENFAKQFQDADSYGSLLKLSAPDCLETSVPEIQNMIKIYQILNQDYHIVVTNPPYMGSANMNPKLSAFVRENFPDSKADLFACFIEKCGQLTKKYGFYAMITMQSWMFLVSFEKLRKRLLHHDIVNLLHLGANAFDKGEVGTIVQATAFVIRNSDIPLYLSKYMNLCDTNQKQEKFFNYPEFYLIQKQKFCQIPSQPYAYWASEQIFQLFSGEKLGNFAEPRQGMTTSDNRRFIRKWYEVSISRICFHAVDCQTAQQSRKKWFPYNKGGGYRKWYGNHEYLVNYEDDGRELKEFHSKLNQVSSGGRIKNKEYYFRKSIAWTFIATTSGFRYCPEGFIFDVAGSSLFTEEELFDYILAFLCSCVAEYLLHLLNPTMNIQVNDIKSLPYRYQEHSEIQKLTAENISLCKQDWDSFETSWDFQQHPLI